MIDLKMFFIVLLLCGLIPFNLYSQSKIDIDSERQKQTFEATFWEPDKGVKLLSDESAQKRWQQYHSSCSTPRSVGCLFGQHEAWSHLTSLVVFETESLIIFVYTRFQLEDATPNWLVYEKESKRSVYNAHSLDAGYEVSTSPPKGTEACSNTVHTSSRFRPYTTDGPLLLETHLNICQRDENHHEFLFHLDEDTLVEVEGSRFVMDHRFYSKEERPWTWWYGGKKYFRFGKLGWNKDGERTWTRQLVVSPLGDEFFGFQGSRFEQTCHYNKEKRAIQCKYEKTKDEEIPMKDGRSFRENNKPHWLKYEKEFSTMGLSYSKELRSWLEDD